MNTNASTKEYELTTEVVKQYDRSKDGTVGDQSNNKKPLNRNNEAATEEVTTMENLNEGKENTNGDLFTDRRPYNLSHNHTDTRAEEMNSKHYDATTQEDEVTTETVKEKDKSKDGTVEDQGNNNKPVSNNSETTTTKHVTTTESPKNGAENTTDESKLTGNTARSKINADQDKEMQRYQLFKIGAGLIRYVFGTLFLPMLICSIISFVVMNLKHNRGHSTCVYMAALAGSDTVSLLHYFKIWIQREAKLHPSTNPLCKFNVFLVHTCWTLSAY